MDARLVCIILGVAFLAPVVHASEASGSFLAQGSLRLPSDATARLQAVGAYVGAFETGIRELRLDARTLHVHRYETTVMEARLPGDVRPGVTTASSTSTYTLTNVSMTLVEGDHRGFLGLYFPREGAPVSARVADAADLLGQTGTRLGESVNNAGNEADAPAPATQGYAWESEEPLVLATWTGDLDRAGTGSLKVMGPDLRFAAQENDTAYATGIETDGDAPAGERRARWFYLEFEDASLHVASSEPMQVAARRADVAWTGVASFQSVDGAITTPEGTYAASGARVRVEGTLTATLRPERAGAAMGLRLDIAGDLRGTTLVRTEATAVPKGARPAAWGLLLALVGLVGLAVYITIRASRRREARAQAHTLVADDRLALARIEAGRERFHHAVAHVREARTQSPGSVRLILEEASYLGAMGRVEEALIHYAEAARLDPEGDADFQAAVLLLQSGGDPARAEGLFVTALARSPILVLDALYDVSGTFDALRGRPAFEAAVDGAKREMGET